MITRRRRSVEILCAIRMAKRRVREGSGKGTSIERDGIGKFLKYRNPWNALVLPAFVLELPFPVPGYSVASIFVQNHDQISRVAPGSSRIRSRVTWYHFTSTRTCYLFDLKCDTFSSFAARTLASISSAVSAATTRNYFIDAGLSLPTALYIE